MALPTRHAGHALRGICLDSQLQAQLPDWDDLVQSFWGWQGKTSLPARRSSRRREPRVGLCFSLGVDSFYSLFQHQPDDLIFVGGYDVPCQRTDVLAAYARSGRSIAAALGKRWIQVDSNVRQHPFFDRTNWEITHGGALAAVGHMLTDEIGTLLLSASYHQSMLRPWGTHPQLDPLWSSTRLEVKHVGDEAFRGDKLIWLMRHPEAEPLLRQHLRVCWENPQVEMNCGRCEKCVRTQMVLHRYLPDARLDTMPAGLPLTEAIAGIPQLPSEAYAKAWAHYAQYCQPDMADEIQQLVKRSLPGASKEREALNDG